MVVKKNDVKKVWATFEEVIELPEGVTGLVENNILTIKGPKGEISKFFRFPRVYLEVEGNKVKIGSKKYTQSEKKIIFTYIAHVNNLIRGVTLGFEYKLAVVYAKFPVSVEMKGDQFIVKNLLGEKVPRISQVPQDVKVQVAGKDITVSGIDKERVGQVAANLEQLTRITHLDRRVIQDGIFITLKPKRSMD